MILPKSLHSPTPWRFTPFKKQRALEYPLVSNIPNGLVEHNNVNSKFAVRCSPIPRTIAFFGYYLSHHPCIPSMNFPPLLGLLWFGFP
jgi:hypothetical protein